MSRIIAFGNPLIDTTVDIGENNEILQKYQLKPDEQKEFSPELMNDLLNHIKNYKQEINAGGCAQNTLRVLKWLLPEEECVATIFGSIGDDSNGKTLKSLLQNDCVHTRYSINPAHPTGVTVALVNGPNRALVAYLGAASKFHNLDKLKKDQKFCETLNADLDLVYIEGFFIADKNVEIAKYVIENKPTHTRFAFNLSAPYLCENEAENVRYFVANCDILFGNRSEFRTICGGRDFVDFLRDLSGSGKTVVVTDGPREILVGAGGELSKFKVPQLSEAGVKIVDTTGAGDAFVGGFLAGVLKAIPVSECVRLGCYAAQEIIQKVGCQIPRRRANIAKFY